MKSLLLYVIILFGWINSIAQRASPAFKLKIEKTYLHTDRDIYAPGDTLWFKAYLVSAQDNRLVNSSNNLYVDLISPDMKILKSLLIRLDNGTGNGDIDLPDSLAAGAYRIRAYTNWMRNFGDNFIFEKTISVLNIGEVAAVAAGKKAAGKKVAVNNQMTYPARATATATTAINFYPEGGSLVTGITSFVAVKTDNGNGFAASGAIVSSSGDTVNHFTCDSRGMGLFALLPLKGQFYRAVVKDKSYPIPAALDTGPALQVRQTDSLMRVMVSSSEDVAALVVKPVYTLNVKYRGVTLIRQPLQLAAQQTVVQISTTDLPEGIAAVTLYDEQNKPNCERLVYIHHPNQLLPTITTDKKTYQPKEKVSVQIDAKAVADLSVAVVDAGIVPEQQEDIVSYLMLSSEIKGNIENARRYFDTTNVNRFKQLNLLMMTQGWRDFIWRRMEDTVIRINYTAENSVTISGKIRDEVSNKWLPQINVTLFANDARRNKIFTAKTDSLGKFIFPDVAIYGTQNVKLTSINAKGEKKGSIWIDTAVAMPVKPRYKFYNTEMPADSSIVLLIQKRINDYTKLSRVTKLKEVKIVEKEKILLNDGGIHMSWGPDKTETFNITPNDYKYRNLEWFILQRARGAMISTNADVTGPVFVSEVTATTISPTPNGSMTQSHRTTGLTPPILVVNGWQLSMDDKIQAEVYRNIYFNMFIQKFKKIVITELIGGERIVYLTMNENALIDNPGTLSVDVPGYYQVRTFYQPPPNAKPQLADYRSTIYWKPNIKTDAAGKATVSFYNTIVPGDVRIMVQGVTGNGVPVVNTEVYTIK